MKFSLIPKLQLDSVLDLKPEMLKSRGISLLLLDLDNTLCPYFQCQPNKDIRRFAARMKAEGISLFLVSNSKSDRPAMYAKSLGFPFINKAGKPGVSGIKRAMALCGKKPEETAMAGDQIFTDVFGANRAGVFSIVVKPLDLKNPLFRLRYGLELPLRAMGRK